MAFKCRKTRKQQSQSGQSEQKNYHEGRIGAQGDITSQLLEMLNNR